MADRQIDYIEFPAVDIGQIRGKFGTLKHHSLRKNSPSRTQMLMSRIARIILEGVPYHVTQRGNGRQQVFFEDRDYSLYLDLLRDNCRKERLPIWATA